MYSLSNPYCSGSTRKMCIILLPVTGCIFNRFPAGSALSRAIWDLNDQRLEKEVFGLKFKNPVAWQRVLIKTAS
jgi:hypothetical protein